MLPHRLSLVCLAAASLGACKAPPSVVVDASARRGPADGGPSEAGGDPGPCAHDLDFTLPGGWTETVEPSEECSVHRVRTASGGVVISKCAGDPDDARKRLGNGGSKLPERAVVDLGDTVTECRYRRRGPDRIEGLACVVAVRARGWIPYVQVEAGSLPLDIAESALRMARAARQFARPCRPDGWEGCRSCRALEQGIAERARVLLGDPPLGPSRSGGPDASPARPVPGLPWVTNSTESAAASEQWCAIGLSAIDGGEMRLERTKAAGAPGCETYAIDFKGDVISRGWACPSVVGAAPKQGMPTEQRSYRWELPPGRFTFDVTYVLDGEWTFSSRLMPWPASLVPATVGFESVHPLDAPTLRRLVAFVSAMDLAPAKCEAGFDEACSRCAEIRAARERVATHGILGRRDGR